MSTNNDKSFFQTLPGILTATATLITAIVGLITVLNQVGLIGHKEETKPKIEQVVDNTGGDSDTETNTSDISKVDDLENIIRKIIKEENASKGKSQAELEETVSKIVKEVKQEEKNEVTSNSKIESITRAFLQDFEEEEDLFDEPDDGGFSGGGSGGVSITSSMVRIGGAWKDYNTGASYVFAQNGNTVSFQEHSLNDYGQQIVSAEGTGSLSGRNIRINYMTMFGTSGVANMIVAPDNSNISCTFRDNTSGVTMNMNLMR